MVPVIVVPDTVPVKVLPIVQFTVTPSPEIVIVSVNVNVTALPEQRTCHGAAVSAPDVVQDHAGRPACRKWMTRFASASCSWRQARPNPRCR